MKKHSCRMTDTEKEMHDRAVKIRKMTDEQLSRIVAMSFCEPRS